MDPDQVEYFREGIKKAKNGTAKATDIGDWIFTSIAFWNNSLEFISVTIKLAEFGGSFHEESPSYPLGALVSDIGGALGLVLGLSILDLLVCSSNFVRKGINGLFAIKRKHDECRNVN